MPDTVRPVLDPDAIETNRKGAMTKAQRDWAGVSAGAQRRNLLTGAVVAAVIGGLVLSSSGGKTPEVERLAFGAGALVIAAVLLVWGVVGTSAIARDRSAGRVETVEGPFGKHTYDTHGTRGADMTHYVFELGEQHFEVGSATYHAAPDHGMMRLYVLPDSHKVVNFEQLPDAPLPPGALDDPAQAVSSLVGGFRSHDQATRLGAMATMAAMEHAVVGPATPPPPEQRDPRPLAEAIVGTWRLGPLSWSFAADGTANGVLPGGHATQGRWSVGADGNLHVAGIEGAQDVAAWVVGDTLTVSLDGRSLNLQRASAG